MEWRRFQRLLHCEFKGRRTFLGITFISVLKVLTMVSVLVDTLIIGRTNLYASISVVRAPIGEWFAPLRWLN